MLIPHVLMALALIGDVQQILCDDQHVSTKIPHTKKVKPLTIQAITSPVAVMPPSVIQEMELDDIMKRMKISGKVSGHFILNAKKGELNVKRKDFRGVLGLGVGGGDVVGHKDAIEMHGIKGPIPSSLFVRFLPESGYQPRFLIIFQVAAVSGLGPHPRVIVGEAGQGLEGPATGHPLKIGAYAALYDPRQFYAGVLVLRAKSGIAEISQVDVYGIETK